MGLRDVLFGRKKLAGAASERLFALSTAAITLDTECGLKSAGAGAVCFKPLSAVFRFDGAKHPVYLVYGYKRGTFWPFVPTGEGQERDNAEELELKSKLEPELPIEPELGRWLGLFDAPL